MSNVTSEDKMCSVLTNLGVKQKDFICMFTTINREFLSQDVSGESTDNLLCEGNWDRALLRLVLHLSHLAQPDY